MRKAGYREGPTSTFRHQGNTYLVDELLALTKHLKSVDFPLSKLAWMVEDLSIDDITRVKNADLSYPIIVNEYTPGKFVTLDGYHRVVKAIQKNLKYIKAIVVDKTIFDKLQLMTPGVESNNFFTKGDARDAASVACDVEGIDPTLSVPERVARLQDIHQGSPLMFEERKRKESYEARAKADYFYKTLRAKLGQD